MNYELISGSTNDLTDLFGTVSRNRQVPETIDLRHLTKSYCLPYKLLVNIDKAVALTLKHCDQNSNIHIVVDPDVDGFVSAAILYMYLKKLEPQLNVTYSLHEKKKHGLTDDITIPKQTGLLFIPDAGSGDFKEHEKLKAMGVDIIVLDHHPVGRESEFAVVVNQHLSPMYGNKSISGAGIVYKFLQALDDQTWEHRADDFSDLLSLSLVADVIDSRSPEARFLMLSGIQKLKSRLIEALYAKVSDRAGELTLTTIAFYIAPLINALIRVGSQKQKELLFEAFCENYQEFDYTPRGKSTPLKEDIFTRAARECFNAKQRQDKQKNTAMHVCVEKIDAGDIGQNKVIMCNVVDIIPSELTGLVCAQVAEYYKRPAILYRAKSIDGELHCQGSARNCRSFPMESLKDFLNDSHLFSYVEGHDSAFGFGFPPQNLGEILSYCNLKLQDVQAQDSYNVDFIADFEILADALFVELDRLKFAWGTNFEPPLFAITNVEIDYKDIEIKSGENNTVMFTADGIKFVRFKVPVHDVLLSRCVGWNYSKASVTLDVVGRLEINSFGWKKTLQVVVNDWNIVDD